MSLATRNGHARLMQASRAGDPAAQATGGAIGATPGMLIGTAAGLASLPAVILAIVPAVRSGTGSRRAAFCSSRRSWTVAGYRRHQPRPFQSPPSGLSIEVPQVLRTGCTCPGLDGSHQVKPGDPPRLRATETPEEVLAPELTAREIARPGGEGFTVPARAHGAPG